MVGRKSLDASIRLYALQNVFVAALAFVLADGSVHLLAAGALLLVVKGILIPWYLLALLERLDVSHEIESYLPVAPSLLASGLLVALAYRVGQGFVLTGALMPEAVPVALALLLLGMLIMSTRKKAVTQVIGFLALENGVFLLALAESHGLPLFIELGIALDTFAAVVLAGILMFRLKSAFGHVDTSRMRDLQG
jgi:hydrogenase-4 component E